MPLTAKQQLEEDRRVRELMTSRSAQQKMQRALSYAGGEGDLVKLSFRPNPSFHAPSLEARVFYDVEGEMWVDCKQWPG